MPGRVLEGSTSAADVEGPFVEIGIISTDGAVRGGRAGHDIPEKKRRTKQIGWGKIVICGGLKSEPWVKLSDLKRVEGLSSRDGKGTAPVLESLE